jgi:hypothetical protein
MNSLNSRFKGFGLGKRKSTASIPPTDNPPASSTPPPQITQTYPPGPVGAAPPQLPPLASQLGPAPTASLASSSQPSLPIMNHPGAGHRPPSYTANFQAGVGAQPPVGRTSPLTQNTTRTPPTQMVGGPPPINTGAPVSGYPPTMHMQPGAQPPPGGPGGPGGPPGYPPTGYPPAAPTPQQQPNNAMGSYGRPAAEVEGNSRSKAQLIVGIDFVRPSMVHCVCMACLTVCRGLGHNVFWRRIRLCNQQ